MIRTTFGGCGLWLLFTLPGITSVSAAEAQIDVELVTEGGVDPAAPQRWFQLLSELGISNLRIRSATGQERVAVEKLGGADSRHYRVTAALTTGNEIIVPGHRFRVGDRAGIAQWFDRLKAAGPEVASSRNALPFDLAPEMLREAQALLSRPLKVATLGADTMEVLRAIHQALNGRLRMSAATREALRDAGRVRDELQGLSVGTALAAIVRPAGLALAPQRSAEGELQFTVFGPSSNSEIWPVGWTAEERRRELVPKLFEFLNVEISGVSVAQAVDVIRQRLGVAILYDHVAMAVHGLDPAEVTAELPAKRTSYSLALQRVLRQAGLKVELRVDEADHPFLWVSSVKPI